jgi:ketosteroid isomerase-like protein
MSAERCVAFMEDLESRDFERLKRWLTDTTELWVPPAPPVTGARRALAMFRAIYRMYPDLHWKVTEVHRIGENRFLYLSDSWGTIGQGRPYRNHLATVITFDGEGRIVTLSDYFKDTAIFGAGQRTI